MVVRGRDRKEMEGKRKEDLRIAVLVRHGREVGDLENGFRIERRLQSL